MNIARDLIQGGSGGLLGGAVLGLIEAIYHLSTAGAPDLVAPFYAVVLYGLMGLGLGLGGGLVLAMIEKWAKAVQEETAWAWGWFCAQAPLLTFVLHYLANKVIYLEQGVPLQGKLQVIGVGVGVPLLCFLLLPILLSYFLAPLRQGKGMLLSIGGLLFVTGALAESNFVPDPRDGWSHDRPAPAALADKPDVLLIMVDTLRADHLGAYGSTLRTPTFDSLAADGVVFEQAFAQASWTRSSGASIFTSRLPSGHNADTKASSLPDDAVTWSEILQAKGVTTGALVNNINLTSTFNFDQGFDTFFYEAPAYRFGATESVFGLTWYKVLHKVSEKVLRGTKDVHRYYQPAEVVLADAQRFIEGNDAGRWGLFVHLMEPHDPYFEHPNLMGTGDAEYNGVGFARAEVEHPDPALAESLKQVYAHEVEFLDLRLAPFIAWLKQSGRYDDTLIIVTADHGEEFYEHGGWWHGTTLYDEQLHVPLIVKVPASDAFKPLVGARAPWTVRSLDIAPTITTALGIAPDPSWEGYDLLADVLAELEQAEVIDEAPTDEAPTDEAPTEEAGDLVADEGSDEVPLDAPPPAEKRGHARDRIVISEEDFEGNVLGALRVEGLKYLRANEGNPRGLPAQELFDVLTDPHETADLLKVGTAIDGVYPDDLATRMSEALNMLLQQSAGTAVHGDDATIGTAECERLKALGYLSADEDCG